MSKATIPTSLKWLRRLRRWFAWAALWALGVLIIIIIIKPSEPFKGCVHANKNGDAYEALHERDAGAVAWIIRLFLRSRLVGICAANFAEHNDRTIGALSAVALALFTLYLWRATHGLRRYAGIQAGDMQDLLDAAQANAAAAASQAEAMRQLHAASEAQERVMREQAQTMTENLALTKAAVEAAKRNADISERALVELEAPFLYVKVTNPGLVVTKNKPGGGQPSNYSINFGYSRFVFSNYGRTPARIFSYFEKTEITERTADTGVMPAPIDLDAVEEYEIPEGVVVLPNGGDSKEYDFSAARYVFTPPFDPDMKSLFFMGFIRYRDVFANKYRSGFCFVFERHQNNFILIGVSPARDKLGKTREKGAEIRSNSRVALKAPE
jgi:hypothetical protein